jgi:hypothetical protein
VLIILGAVALGVLIGLALGGNVTTLADARFRWWPLAIVGLSLQLIQVPTFKGQLDHWLAVGLLIGSYVVLLLFVLVNARKPGFPLVAAGFALNLLVISVNGGMPVNADALRDASGPKYLAAVRRLDRIGGAKHHLARPGDRLTALSDVIPVGSPVRNVFSVGDLVAMVGIMWVLAGATKGPPGRHRVAKSRAMGARRKPTGTNGQAPTPSDGGAAPPEPPGVSTAPEPLPAQVVPSVERLPSDPVVDPLRLETG